MIESAFVTVNRVISEPSNTFDELRIIAKDAQHLSAIDRDAISRGADELESILRAFFVQGMQLIEMQQRLIAVNERLLQRDADMMALRHPKFPSLSLNFTAPLVGWPIVPSTKV